MLFEIVLEMRQQRSVEFVSIDHLTQLNWLNSLFTFLYSHWIITYAKKVFQSLLIIAMASVETKRDFHAVSKWHGRQNFLSARSFDQLQKVYRLEMWLFVSLKIEVDLSI